MPPRAGLAPGTLLDGRYRLKAVLGEGGMGQVYEGEDIRLSRHVAIKVMHEQGELDDTQGERLFREAKAAARADHHAVVTTYGYGTDPELEVSYVVMERLQGSTLEARIVEQKQLSVEFVLRIALDLADALLAVHAAGVVHRDLKPSNIFLASRGRRLDEIKLLDFGVAKQLDLQTLTSTGQIYGTPMYMAPEQLADSKSATPRCDLYSLGAVLFECLTGRRPFEGRDQPTLISNILFGPPPDLRALCPDVPSELVAIVTCCMERSPQRRFADAGALFAALSAVPKPTAR